MVGADEPERTRSRFRATRSRNAPNRQTASQAAVPLRRKSLPLFVARKNTFSVHAKRCPKNRDFVAAPASLQGGLVLSLRPPPLAHRNWRRATGESRSSNLATVPGRTIAARSTASQFASSKHQQRALRGLLLRARCIRSWRPFSCSEAGRMKCGSMPSLSHDAESCVRPPASREPNGAHIAADRRAGRKSLFLTLGNHVGLRSISLSLLLRVRISAVRGRRSDEGTR